MFRIISNCVGLFRFFESFRTVFIYLDIFGIVWGRCRLFRIVLVLCLSFGKVSLSLSWVACLGLELSNDGTPTEASIGHSPTLRSRLLPLSPSSCPFHLASGSLSHFISLSLSCRPTCSLHRHPFPRDSFGICIANVCECMTNVPLQSMPFWASVAPKDMDTAGWNCTSHDPMPPFAALALFHTFPGGFALQLRRDQTYVLSLFSLTLRGESQQSTAFTLMLASHRPINQLAEH